MATNFCTAAMKTTPDPRERLLQRHARCVTETLRWRRKVEAIVAQARAYDYPPASPWPRCIAAARRHLVACGARQLVYERLLADGGLDAPAAEMRRLASDMAPQSSARLTASHASASPNDVEVVCVQP